MLSVYDEQLRAAEKAQVSYSEFVAGLLRAQWHDRQDVILDAGVPRGIPTSAESRFCGVPPAPAGQTRSANVRVLEKSLPAAKAAK